MLVGTLCPPVGMCQGRPLGSTRTWKGKTWWGFGIVGPSAIMKGSNTCILPTGTSQATLPAPGWTHRGVGPGSWLAGLDYVS